MPEVIEKKRTPAEEYKEKCNEVVKGYYKESHSFDDILSRTGLVTIAELVDKDSKAKFELVKITADKKLTQEVKGLKLEDIDNQLAGLIETASAHTSLKLGIVQFKLRDDEGNNQQLESFNYSGEGAAPKSNIIMRDARLQGELGGGVNKVAGSTPDTYIAVMAGRIRGAVALIDQSTMTDKDKDKAKQNCIDLLQVSVRTLQYTTLPSTEKKAVEHLSKIVKISTNKLIDTLEQQNIKIQNNNKPLEGKKLANALATARDFAMMNTSDDHCHVTTIHRSVGEGKENGFSISAIADPISKQLREEYKNIKDFQDIENGGLPSWYENSGQKAKEEIKKNLLPQWYKEKTLLEQKMIAKNIDNYISGKCVLPSQDRKTAGVANYWAQNDGIIDSSNNVTSSTLLTRGTWGARTKKPTTEDQRIAKENGNHIAESASGKTVTFQNVASNSSLVKAEEKAMHNSMKSVAKTPNKGDKTLKVHTNPLNLLRLLEGKSSLEKVQKHTEKAQKDNGIIHINCMSSKDRTSLAIMISTMKTLYEKTQNKKEVFSAMTSSKHHEFLASMQGGTPGVYSVKLADAMKVTWGLGIFGGIKKEVDLNSSLAKTNKVEDKRAGRFKKFKEMIFGKGKIEKEFDKNLAKVIEAREAREAREVHQQKLSPVLLHIIARLESQPHLSDHRNHPSTPSKPLSPQNPSNHAITSPSPLPPPRIPNRHSVGQKEGKGV